MKVLFVCLGNICRSPAAEGVFLHLIQEKGLSNSFEVDSAGTSSVHSGERADPRMREHALKRGIELPSRARQFKREDFKHFDSIVVMDDSNYRNVVGLAENNTDIEKVIKMASFCPLSGESEVPDPYYGGAAGFEKVLDMVTEGSENLLTSWGF
ncbi:MAG: low molecular weight phosphotyrosine protein phosphatase [Bacteriovoracaceae bacterium]|nr:low molecular weight phosphotyrosine protein phosphatase [Bacteriovoracaceae bacterium]